MDFQLDTEPKHHTASDSSAHESHKTAAVDMDAVKKDMKIPPFTLKGIDWKKEIQNVIELYKGTAGKIHEIIEAPNNLSVAVVFILASAIAAGLGLYFAWTPYISIGYVLSYALVLFVNTIVSFVITGLLARQVFHVKQNTYSFLKLGGYLYAAQIVQIIPVVGWIAGAILGLWSLAIFYRAAKEEFKLSVRDIVLLIVLTAVTAYVINLVLAGIFGLGVSRSIISLR
jgi:hypothetical protein